MRETPDIIDLDPASVTDHDKPAKSAGAEASTARSPFSASPVIVGVTALVIGAIAGGWAYRDYLWHYLPNVEVTELIRRTEGLATDNATLKEQVASLQQLSAQLKADIDANETIMASANATAKSAASAITDLSTRVDGIATTVADTTNRINTLATDLQNQPATVDGTAPAAVPADLLQRLEALEKDVASLKVQKDTGAADTALLSQGLADLKAKIAAGAPFKDELDRLARLVPAAPGLAELAPYAPAGIPDSRLLAKQLSELAASLPTAGELQPVTPKDDSWTGWVLDTLSDLVTVRIAGASDWRRGAEAAAAFAESGDLQQAIDHLGGIEGPRPPGIEQWLEAANARLAVDGQISSVEAAVLRAIAAKG